jgi:hypothetical protein
MLGLDKYKILGDRVSIRKEVYPVGVRVEYLYLYLSVKK